VNAVGRCVRILDVVAPERCVVCGGLVRLRMGGYPLCEECETGMQEPEGRRCGTCSKPLVSERETCMECRGESYSFECNHSIFLYDDPLKECLSAYKSRGVVALKRFFASRLARSYRERFDGKTLVPVPFRPESVRKRGYDQIGLICEELARRHGIPIESLLVRTGRSLEQKSLDRESRKANLRNRIRPSRNPGRADVPEEIVLLDDVFTTGATVDECARVLRNMGVKRVFVLTLARD